ncbi:MAG: FtsX-like permease family protein [Gemmatimonadota bacterium]
MAKWWPTALERRIALRYLRGQRGTRSASLQTTIAIGSIAVGVTALIVVLGVMNGLRDDLRDKILVGSPHVHVLTFGANLEMQDWRNQLKKVQRYPGVIAAAPEVTTMSLVINSSRYTEGVKVLGLEPGDGMKVVTDIQSAIVEGDGNFSTTAPDVRGAVVLGAGLARRLSVRPGDVVTMVEPNLSKVNAALGMPTPVYWRFEVTGTFQTGMYIYDNEFVVMTRALAQEFAGLDSAVTEIGLRLANPDDAPKIATGLADQLGYPYRAEAWQAQNATLFSALELEKRAMGLVIFFIMIVAALNIVGTLTMVVAFKTREIGILQAMGLPSSGVARIFLAQGAIIGIIGTSIGLVLGLVIAVVVDRSGAVKIDPSVYFIDHLPVRIEPLDVVVVVVASILVAILATIPPARSASSLVPVDAIRAE